MLQVRYTHKKKGAPTKCLPPLPPNLALRIGFLLGRSGGIIRELFDKTLIKYHIHCKHYGILSTLSETNSRTQHELSEILRIDRSTMVTLINEAEKLGYIVRRENPLDRRAHLIELAQKGRNVYQMATKSAGEMEKKFLSPLTRQEWQQLHGLLSKLLHGYFEKLNSEV